MAAIILVTGGTRSGKSLFAQTLAEKLPAPHCFIATCQASDEEMAERVKKHQKERSIDIWNTVEEKIDLKNALSQNVNFSTYLVECVTLWVSNVMEHCHQLKNCSVEETLEVELARVITHAKHMEGTLIFVTNEVGMGIVPENRLARQYRDHVGLCNRTIATHADEVILVSCGLPLYLKK